MGRNRTRRAKSFVIPNESEDLVVTRRPHERCFFAPPDRLRSSLRSE